MGLVRSLQPWDILLIYYNNQLKSSSLAKTNKGGTLWPPSDVYVRSFLCPFFSLIKICYTKAFEWSSLVPGPKAKSSLEIRSNIFHHKLSLARTISNIPNSLMSQSLVILGYGHCLPPITSPATPISISWSNNIKWLGILGPWALVHAGPSSGNIISLFSFLSHFKYWYRLYFSASTHLW